MVIMPMDGNELHTDTGGFKKSGDKKEKRCAWL